MARSEIPAGMSVTFALCSMAMRGSSTASSHSKTVQHQIDQEQLLAGAGKVRGEASGELVKSVSGRQSPFMTMEGTQQGSQPCLCRSDPSRRRRAKPHASADPLLGACVRKPMTSSDHATISANPAPM
jgi:hypothetical protein